MSRKFEIGLTLNVRDAVFLASFLEVYSKGSTGEIKSKLDKIYSLIDFELNKIGG